VVGPDERIEPGAGDPPAPDLEYSVGQANRMLPALTQVLRTLLEELGQATDPDVLGRLRAVEGHNGGGPAAAAVLRAGDRVAREMKFLERNGIVLRDAAAGLVDFPATRQGRAIYLCWRLGEAEVGYWHARDQGYVNRQPL